MASFGGFAAQLESCVQSQDEIDAFIEEFAKVRIRRIMHLMDQPAILEWPTMPKAEWASPAKLAESGLKGVKLGPTPWTARLHVDIALLGSQTLVDRYITMTGVSDKQSRAVFPVLCSSKARRDPGNRAALARDVAHANAWLSWIEG